MLEEQIKKIAVFAAIDQGDVRVTQIKKQNDVYMIECPLGKFFLKTYTKDWYSSDPAQTGGCVDHEASAWRILARHGLATPEIAAADMTCSNPLQRPYILTKALTGQSFTEVIKDANPQDFAAGCSTAGDYLRKMHEIRFKFPGYLYGDGPTIAPNPDEWQHSIWVYAAQQKYAEAFMAQDRVDGLGDLVERSRAYIQTQERALRASYADPRFIVGDCHAHQLFILKDAGTWKVTGSVDMETSSAGERGADFVKFSLEMASLFPVETRWWAPFLAAYDKDYDFGVHKARMLLAGPENYWCVAWPGDRRRILTHLLAAESWEELFDLRRI